MTDALPWLLLVSTISVRLLFARQSCWGWCLDMASVPAWLWLYGSRELWPLLPIPVIFAVIDVRGVQRWRQLEAIRERTRAAWRELEAKP